MSPQFLLLVVLRALTDALAEAFKMHALCHGDISAVSCFVSLSPLFLLLLSPLITGDALTIQGALAVLLVVSGSLLLVHRPAGAAAAVSVKGVVFGISASFFFSLNSCFDRLAVQIASPVLSGFSMTVVAALLLMPFVVSNQPRVQQLSRQAKPFWLRGFFEIAYMVSKLCALQYLQAPHVVAIGKLSLLVSIIGGRIFFNESQFGRRLAAGLLILTGVLVIVIAEVHV